MRTTRRKRIVLAAAAFLALGAAAGAGEPAKGFTLKAVNDKSLGLWERGKPVLVYNHGTISKKGVPARYNRACYVHPLHGLDGEVLTEDFPVDHRHHRGVFWAWPHVRIGGKEYNSWIPTGIHYRLDRWVRKEAGPKRACLEAVNGWYVGEKKVADEHLRITVHPARADGRAIDFNLTWTATDQPITLQGAGGKSYGGFTVRFNTRLQEKDGLKPKDATITAPDGVTKKDLAVTPLAWADFTAALAGAGKRSGLALLVHPTHPAYPPTWLTRHYGCLCVGWPGVKPGTLQPGKPVRCRYRLWVHRGPADLETLKKAYAAYVKDAPRAPAASP